MKEGTGHSEVEEAGLEEIVVWLTSWKATEASK